MIEKYQNSYNNYQNQKNDFINYLDKKIRKIGTVKLSVKIGKSASYITKALRKRTGSFKFWLDLYWKIIEVEEEREKKGIK